MAFLKKPLKWTALGQEPSELKKNEGFKMDESPAPGHFDFMFRSTYEAIEELQQKAGEVKTVNNVQPDVNGNVLITLPDTSKLYQKPTSGIPKTDLDATVQASLKKADDAAPLTELAKTNQALTTHQAEYAQFKTSTEKVLNDFESTKDLSITRSNKDSDGTFTTVTYRRKKDNSLYGTDVLSGGVAPNYTTRTIKLYDTDGITLLKTIVKTITYDSDGDWTEDV